VVGHDRLDVARPDKTQPNAGTPRSDRRKEPRLLVGTEHDHHPCRRLLERLEQRRLGVLVHPFGTLDDRHPGPALDGHQGELRDQVANAR
jgi:hypothetical protein